MRKNTVKDLVDFVIKNADLIGGGFRCPKGVECTNSCTKCVVEYAESFLHSVEEEVEEETFKHGDVIEVKGNRFIILQVGTTPLLCSSTYAAFREGDSNRWSSSCEIPLERRGLLSREHVAVMLGSLGKHPFKKVESNVGIIVTSKGISF